DAEQCLQASPATLCAHGSCVPRLVATSMYRILRSGRRGRQLRRRDIRLAMQLVAEPEALGNALRHFLRAPAHGGIADRAGSGSKEGEPALEELGAQV